MQRSAKFAKYLPDFGYRPLVLAGAEDQIQITTRHVDASLMRDVEHTTVFPCRGNENALVGLPDRIEPLRRLLKFCLLPDLNVLAWLPQAEQLALRIARQHPISAIYTSVGPFSSGLLARRLKRALGVPWVVDFRDPWADDCIRFWPTKLHYRIEAQQEREVVEAADAVVVVTPTMQALMARRYPRWAHKIHMICNGFDPQDFPDRNGRACEETGTGSLRPCAERGHSRSAEVPVPVSSQARRVPASCLQIAHTGKMIDFDRRTVRGSWGPLSRFWFSHVAFRHAQVDFSTHSPYYLLKALRALLDERPQWRDQIRLVFAGVFGDRNLQLVRDLRLEGVVSNLGYLPHDESVQLLLDSDVLFLPLMTSTDDRRSYIYTGKVFEYLATRKPILAAVPEGDARDLIGRIGAGWCVDPRDVGAIKNLLADLIEKKQQGRLGIQPDEQIIRGFERRELTRQLAGLLDSLTSGERAAHNRRARSEP